jgi:hypothetical protein
VRLSVDVIVTYGTAASSAAKQATTAIPIVMLAIGDPVRSGLVASLARPGGNITGNTILGPEIAAKRLQLFKEVIPTISRLAFLWNPNNASHAAYLEEWKAAAPALGATNLPGASPTPSHPSPVDQPPVGATVGFRVRVQQFCRPHCASDREVRFAVPLALSRFPAWNAFCF